MKFSLQIKRRRNSFYYGCLSWDCTKAKYGISIWFPFVSSGRHAIPKEGIRERVMLTKLGESGLVARRSDKHQHVWTVVA
ncbi:hypothetical protein BRADI_1g63696v3 [Brachypodium distachyon]|uniref:Uncharacterized protein n=1 Tax=Brachypodium distachyon TaxID=15368 RepID=A0A2K2DT89_BRADI|nr:hypothetical protein BRADI_1g63696v3 [Brachypodium distachyon]